MAQALRQITSEGTLPCSNVLNHTNSFFTVPGHDGSYHQLPPPAHYSSDVKDKYQVSQSSSILSFDRGSSSLIGGTLHRGGADLDSVLDIVGMHMDGFERGSTPTQLQQSKLSLLTDVGRRYPGYPSALSPTFDAKQLYPSPDSETASGFATPRIASPSMEPVTSLNVARSMVIDSRGVSGHLHELSVGDAHSAHPSTSKARDSQVETATRNEVTSDNHCQT